MAAPPLTRIRRLAVSSALFAPTTLQRAIDRLGFIQADPIRSPARAQDLILRHRVAGYRAGDLERHYGSLEVEEDYLYAYGFVSRRVWRLLHPRTSPRMRAFHTKVLETVRLLGQTHPRALEPHLGTRRVINAWGGYSKATTDALEWLHWRGLLRIARREAGVRVYEAVSIEPTVESATARLRALVMVYARIFAPSPQNSLLSVVAPHRDLGNTRAMVADMVDSGELRSEDAGGISYLSPAETRTDAAVAPTVRFLAPFDPLVWDRGRFARLWGWQYRFEAYTPVAKRVRGYYAMPMLWKDDIVGWVNVRPQTNAVEAGFVRGRPRARHFQREFDAEVARLETFLGGDRIPSDAREGP
jgi:hypothetical protein